ncbi:hypothetical protein [Aeromicrobium sp. CnD17-E]|uniref:hypothetical protein n=1 Tax=Aeromicrobium sp. CnD17-E TaxID=2954487 RepID=UPI00209685FF|nr:hypothetical protein [Aeromicrobium sp. CnD17-E]MCO7238400.1 hypothetical protein [Aeromicrobium sp. CnD17-E]
MRVIGVERDEVDRVSQVLLRMTGDGGTPTLEELFSDAVVDDGAPEMAFVLAGMASAAVSELSRLSGQPEAAVVGALRARIILGACRPTEGAARG